MNSRWHREYRTSVLDEIGGSISDIAATFYKGAEGIADIIVDDKSRNREIKFLGVKRELVSMVKNIKYGTEKGLRFVTPGRMASDLFRAAGRLSGRVKADCLDLFNDLMGN